MDGGLCTEGSRLCAIYRTVGKIVRLQVLV